MAEERVDAMLALRRAEERRLAGSEVCARDWTPAKKGGGKIPEEALKYTEECIWLYFHRKKMRAST